MALPIAGWQRLDDEWTNVMFVGRVIPNKKFEDVIRAFHAYRTRHNPRSRLLLVGSYSGFEKYLAMLQGLVARLGTPDVHFLGHVSNEELTARVRRRRPVSLRERARRILCADRRSLLQAHPGARLRARLPFRPRWTAAACCTTPRIRWRSRRLMDAVLDDPRIEEAVLAIAGRVASAAPRQGFRWHASRDSLTRRWRGHLAKRQRSPGISGSSSISSIGSRNCASSGRRCIRRYR